MCRLVKDSYKSAGLAYALSKNFAVWYAQKSAFELGSRGIRVCSLSPGLIATDMGELEKGEGASMLKYTVEKRMPHIVRCSSARSCSFLLSIIIRNSLSFRLGLCMI